MSLSGDRACIGLCPGRFGIVLWALLAGACGASSPTTPTPVPTTPIVTLPTPDPTPTPSPTPTPVPTPVPPPAPTIGISNVMAFGDSLTEGVLSQEGTFRLYQDLPSSYPTKLRAILERRYPTQRVLVTNEGVRGEWAATGQTRFPARLEAIRPQAVLLLEGVNDLSALGRRAVASASAAVDSMVRDARVRNVRVFLATMTPTRPGSPLGDDIASLIPDFNNEIRRIAVSRGAVLVDLESAFGRDLSLLGPDGLHPNEAGYERMAVTFFEALRATYEETP